MGHKHHLKDSECLAGLAALSPKEARRYPEAFTIFDKWMYPGGVWAMQDWFSSYPTRQQRDSHHIIAYTLASLLARDNNKP